MDTNKSVTKVVPLISGARRSIAQEAGALRVGISKPRAFLHWQREQDLFEQREDIYFSPEWAFCAVLSALD